jgi:hypothetical protein
MSFSTKHDDFMGNFIISWNAPTFLVVELYDNFEVYLLAFYRRSWQEDKIFKIKSENFKISCWQIKNKSYFLLFSPREKRCFLKSFFYIVFYFLLFSPSFLVSLLVWLFISFMLIDYSCVGLHFPLLHSSNCL